MIDTLTFLGQLRLIVRPHYIANHIFKSKSKKNKIYPDKYLNPQTTFEDSQTFNVFICQEYNLLKANIF
jgi:hypothetical protein